MNKLIHFTEVSFIPLIYWFVRKYQNTRTYPWILLRILKLLYYWQWKDLKFRFIFIHEINIKNLQEEEKDFFSR